MTRVNNHSRDAAIACQLHEDDDDTVEENNYTSEETHTTANMHPTQPLFRTIRRLALNTKQAGKDFYKGNRTGSMGSHTKWGGYLIDYKKVRTYVCPDLSGFNVRKGNNCYPTIFVGCEGARC
jgi:hypothetical protein